MQKKLLMWLVCKANRSAWGKKTLHVKVTSYAEAVQKAIDWAKTHDVNMTSEQTVAYRVQKCSIVVKGATLAGVDLCARRVYWADPVTEKLDKTRDALFDSGEYDAQVLKDALIKELLIAQYKVTKSHSNECWKLLCTQILTEFGDNQDVDLKNVNEKLKRIVDEDREFDNFKVYIRQTTKGGGLIDSSEVSVSLNNRWNTDSRQYAVDVSCKHFSYISGEHSSDVLEKQLSMVTTTFAIAKRLEEIIASPEFVLHLSNMQASMNEEQNICK